MTLEANLMIFDGSSSGGDGIQESGKGASGGVASPGGNSA